jgi:hypothetical protein
MPQAVPFVLNMVFLAVFSGYWVAALNAVISKPAGNNTLARIHQATIVGIMFLVALFPIAYQPLPNWLFIAVFMTVFAIIGYGLEWALHRFEVSSMNQIRAQMVIDALIIMLATGAVLGITIVHLLVYGTEDWGIFNILMVTTGTVFAISMSGYFTRQNFGFYFAVFAEADSLMRHPSFAKLLVPLTAVITMMVSISLVALTSL